VVKKRAALALLRLIRKTNPEQQVLNQTARGEGMLLKKQH
jgi:hypothetical protein